MKLRNFVMLSILAAVLCAACGPRVYAKADLEKRNAKETVCTITVQSRGSFKCRAEGGEELHFRTGQLTQYIPEGYRSDNGQKVRVAYEEILERTGNVKLAVLQLEGIGVSAEDVNRIYSLSGVIRRIEGYESNRAKILLLPEGKTSDRDVVVFYSDPELVAVVPDRVEQTRGTPVKPKFAVGDRVALEYQNKPLLRGNDYAFFLTKIEKR